MASLALTAVAVVGILAAEAVSRRVVQRWRRW
jgi:hypothetical protein